MKTLKALTLGAAAICMLAVTTTPQAQSFAQDEGYKPNRKDTLPTREQLEEMGYTGVLPLFL